MEIELKTARLTLRPLSIHDLNTVHTYASDIENTRYMLHLPNDTIEQTSHFLEKVTAEWMKEKPNFYEFAVVLDGEQIGAVSVSLNEKQNEGELGWIIHKKSWGKGYATEAAEAVRNFAINELKLTKLVAHCDDRNTASSNVMQKIGLTLESESGERIYPKTAEIARELMYSMTNMN